MCLGRQPCPYDTTPVMRNHDKPPFVTKVFLSHAQYEPRHSFQHIVGIVLGKRVAASITWEVDGDEGVWKKGGRGEKPAPEEVGVREACAS